MEGIVLRGSLFVLRVPGMGILNRGPCSVVREGGALQSERYLFYMEILRGNDFYFGNVGVFGSHFGRLGKVRA